MRIGRVVMGVNQVEARMKRLVTLGKSWATLCSAFVFLTTA